VVCWGYNYYGQLGRGTAGVLGGEDGVTAEFVSNLSDVTDVSASNQHTCATKGNGELWCWGANGLGALGNDCSALPCQQASDAALFSPLPMLAPLSNATTSAGGLGHTCAVADGAVYCWGDNRSGQLGNGEVSAGMNPTPTRVLWK
jgi:alpha-tubulin suppressor-like RCC1 family protein